VTFLLAMWSQLNSDSHPIRKRHPGSQPGPISPLMFWVKPGQSLLQYTPLCGWDGVLGDVPQNLSRVGVPQGFCGLCPGWERITTHFACARHRGEPCDYRSPASTCGSICRSCLVFSALTRIAIASKYYVLLS
jgi:hypothetical protein